MVDDAAKMIHRQRMRHRICHEEKDRVSCRATMLKVAFANHFNHWQGPAWKPLTAYKQIALSLYDRVQKVTLYATNLPDRDPFTNEDVLDFHGYTRTKRPLPLGVVCRGMLLKAEASHRTAHAPPATTTLCLRRGDV